MDEMLTTAGKTALTTGENVAGMVAASRTAGAAAAGSACVAEPRISAPPAIDPMVSMSAAITHTGYLLVRYIVVISLSIQFQNYKTNMTGKNRVGEKGV